MPPRDTKGPITKLVEVRVPTRADKKDRGRGAEVVFVRQYTRGVLKGRKVTVYAAKCHESYEQWGAETDVLWDNVGAVSRWREQGMDVWDANDAEDEA